MPTDAEPEFIYAIRYAHDRFNAAHGYDDTGEHDPEFVAFVAHTIGLNLWLYGGNGVDLVVRAYREQTPRGSGGV